MPIRLLFDSIIDHSIGATVILDGEGVILRSSAAVEQLLLENPTGRFFDDAFPLWLIDPDGDAENTVPDRFLIRHVLDGAAVNGLQAIFNRKDGTAFSLLMAAKPLAPNGGLFKGAVVSLMDLTPLKIAEVQLVVLNQQLRYHFELIKTITDNTSEALFLTDLEGGVNFINPAAEKKFGWTADNLIGKNLHQAMHPRHDPVDSPAQACPLCRTGDTIVSEIREDVFADANGKSLSVCYSKSPVINYGKITGAVYSVRDISERKLSEAALRLSEEKLRQSQKMEAIGRLAGGIAHDFNNLLTAINGYAALGLERLDPDPTMRIYLEEIRGSGERAAVLTSQLLSYSRKQMLSFKVVDLNDVVKDTLSLVRRTLGENIQFQVELHPGACVVNVDANHIQQVIVNMAINARDAMPNGGTLRLETKPWSIMAAVRAAIPDTEDGAQPGDYIQFCITDDGHGMDPSVLAHLFEPFFTTKEVGKGTGLGLSMAYGIVKQHRGHIQVSSEVGKGSSFKLLFPVARRAQPSESIRPLPAAAAAAAAARGDETVLLVEDEEAVLSLLRKVLTDNGYKVLEAMNGVDALEVSDAYPGPVHLLVTDVLMSRMGGHELGEALKLRRPDMPQIFISGYNEDSFLHRDIRDDRILFLQKPFTPMALVRLVRKTLDHERATAVLPT